MRFDPPKPEYTAGLYITEQMLRSAVITTLLTINPESCKLVLLALLRSLCPRTFIQKGTKRAYSSRHISGARSQNDNLLNSQFSPSVVFASRAVVHLANSARLIGRQQGRVCNEFVALEFDSTVGTRDYTQDTVA